MKVQEQVRQYRVSLAEHLPLVLQMRVAVHPQSQQMWFIASQPAFPATPTQTVDCSLGPGKADITVTAPLGTGLQYRLDAGAYQSGTSFINVADGNHTISVRNSSGCVYYR